MAFAVICTCEMEPKDVKFSRYGRGMEWRKMGQQLLFEMLKCLLTVTESCREILKERQQDNKKALISAAWAK